jgi:hypothetical protein
VRTVTIVVLTLLSVSGATLHAQRIPPSPFPRAELIPAVRARQADARMPRRNTGPTAMIFGGVLGGAAGLVTGAIIGNQFRQQPCEDCWIEAFYGALAGESIGVPLGVHLANGRGGRSLPALAASLAIGAVGLGAAILSDEPRLLLAVPVLQVAASVTLERRTAGVGP